MSKLLLRGLGGLALTSTLFFSVACEQPEESNEVTSIDEYRQQLQYSRQDNPSLFSNDLVYTFADLPTSGASEKTPWTSSYWPNAKDSINYKWDGANSTSASAKYGKAFGVDGVEDSVSRMRGIDSVNGSSCQIAEDCTRVDAETGEDVVTGDVCAKREGHDQGRCIPGWYGICHAWAPASMMVDEPKHPVTMNGVEFKVNDIKALLTLSHDRVRSKFVGSRCNFSDNLKQIEYDEFDRPINPECINTNPATLHILMSNYLGLKKQSFIMDRTFDDQVWNQPLRSFNVDWKEEVTAQQANALVGEQNNATYRFNESGNAVKFFEIYSRLNYISESSPHLDGNLEAYIDSYTYTDYYHYILEIDANGRLIGGEWLGDSKKSHPDFLWLPTRVSSSTVAEGKINYQKVMKLAALSVADDNNNNDDSDNDDNNNGHQQNYEMDFNNLNTEQTIELGPFTSIGDINFVLSGTGDVDLYVKKNGAASPNDADCTSYGDTSEEFCPMPEAGSYYIMLYTYRGGSVHLSVDWNGDAYTGPYSHTDDNVDNGDDTIHDDGDIADIQNNGRQTLDMSFRLETGESVTIGPIKVFGGRFNTYLGGNGNIDLYVKRGSETNNDCSSTNAGSSEFCRLTVKGYYYVTLRAVRSGPVRIKADWYGETYSGDTMNDNGSDNSGGMNDTTVNDEGLQTRDMRFNIAAGQVVTVGPFKVSSGRIRFDVGGNGNINLYVKKGANATLTDFDCSSTNEGSTEACYINNASGEYYVTLHAVKGASVRLKSSWRGEIYGGDAQRFPVEDLN